jgi:hypothetical protein
MSGEGRGHATRARALVEALRGTHQITLFAADCAYRLLEPIYRGTDVRLLEIPGLRFSYSRPGRVDLLGTLAGAVRYRMSSARYVRSVLPEFERAKPDLVIADFVARRSPRPSRWGCWCGPRCWRRSPTMAATWWPTCAVS